MRQQRKETNNERKRKSFVLCSSLCRLHDAVGEAIVFLVVAALDDKCQHAPSCNKGLLLICLIFIILPAWLSFVSEISLLHVFCFCVCVALRSDELNCAFYQRS